MKRINLMVLLSLSIAVSACGSNNDEVVLPVSGSNKLKPVVNAQEFERSYKQSLIDFYENQMFSVYYTDGVLESDVPVSSESSTSDTPSDSNSVSITSTNLQEQGVDEADRIKTDGESLYVLEARTYSYGDSSTAVETSQPYEPNVSDTGNKISIFQLNPDESDYAPVREVELNLDDRMLADGLFLFNEGEQQSLVVTQMTEAITKPCLTAYN